MKTTFYLVLSVCLLQNVFTQDPCSSLDPGPYLGTKPTLVMQVYEATQADLDMYPNSEKYKSELRVSGNIGDSGNQGISIEMMENFQMIDPRDVFQFETEVVSGKNFLKVVSPVDRDGPSGSVDDDINLFSFTIKCVPASNTSTEIFYDVRIIVRDVNDNYPVFFDSAYAFTVNELTPVGTKVAKVFAEDMDFLDNSNITYSLVPANVDDGSSVFAIDPLSGDVIVAKMLDYESLSGDHTYNLEVMAKDSDLDSPKSSKTMVKVAVTDGDDQGPAFEYDGCFRHKSVCAWPKYTTPAKRMKLGEPLIVYPVPNKVGHPVTIKARDLDPTMSEVKFSIASTIPPGYESSFSVTTNHAGGPFYTAAVTQIKALTVTEGFEIFLKVEESSGHKRHEIAMIYFTGQNSGNSAGSATTQSPAVSKTEGQEGNPKKEPTPTGTSKDILALIIVVAILAAFVLCLALAFLCYVYRRSGKKGEKFNLESRQAAFTNAAYTSS